MPDCATSARNSVASLSLASIVSVNVTSCVSGATSIEPERMLTCVCGCTLLVKIIGAFGDSNDRSFT